MAIVNGPFDGAMAVTFVSQCDFKGAENRLVVSVRYKDPKSSYSVTDTRILHGDEPTWTWETRLLNRKHTAFEYKVDTIYRYDRSDRGEWRTATGEDGSILVGPTSSSEQEAGILVRVRRVDWDTRWDSVIVHFEFPDTVSDRSRQHVVLLHPDNTTFVLQPPLRDPSLLNFRYTIHAFGRESANNKVIGPVESTVPFVYVDID